MVLERHLHRGARRHPPRRTGALGHRSRGDRRLRRSPRRAHRPSRGHRPQRRRADNPDFLLEVDHIERWRTSTGRCRRAAGCSTAPAGTHGRTTRTSSSTPTRPGRTRPAISVECARWLAEESRVIGVGSRPSAPTRGLRTASPRRSPATPSMLGAGKYGLTQLANLRRLPPTGAVLVVAPLPIVGGSGSPARVLALVSREGRARLRGRRPARSPGSVFVMSSGSSAAGTTR